MELSENQWHVKFYFWCLDVWDAYLDSYTNRHRSSLCQYVRTIFVWMPLAIVMQLAFYAFALYVLLYYPVTHFSFGATAKGYGSIIGMGVAIWLLSTLMDNRRMRRRHTRRSGAVEEQTEPKKENGPGFVEVVWAYLAATKHKVCPIIEFNNSQKEIV